MFRKYQINLDRQNCWLISFVVYFSPNSQKKQPVSQFIHWRGRDFIRYRKLIVNKKLPKLTISILETPSKVKYAAFQIFLKTYLHFSFSS